MPKYYENDFSCVVSGLKIRAAAFVVGLAVAAMLWSSLNPWLPILICFAMAAGLLLASINYLEMRKYINGTAMIENEKCGSIDFQEQQIVLNAGSYPITYLRHDKKCIEYNSIKKLEIGLNYITIYTTLLGPVQSMEVVRIDAFTKEDQEAIRIALCDSVKDKGQVAIQWPRKQQ